MRVAYVLTIVLLLAGSLLAQNNPVPFVNQPLVPDATVPGGPDFTLTVNGTGFVAGATVNWNGTALATTFVTQLQLTATVPAADIVTGRTASVTVTNPIPAGGTSNIQYFSIANSTANVDLTELDWDTGSGPDTESGLVGDFDGDGVLDLAIPGSASGGMCVLLGIGDGSFQPAQCTGGGNLSSNVSFLVAADLNADGKEDIAAVVGNGGGVLVALGNGDGTLQPAVFLLPPPDAQQTEGLAVADFKGDGKLDVLALFHDPDNTEDIVTVYPGNGNGTFGVPIITSLNKNIGPMVIGDFNGDGKLDMAADSYIVLGKGDGTFQAPMAYSDLGARKLIAADMNLDGKLDLIALEFGGGGLTDVSVFLGNGNGTFQQPATFTVNGDLRDLATADVNGDANVDVVFAGFVNGTESIGVLLGNGDGTLRGAAPPHSVALGIGTADLVQIGDFNLDGSPDIATWSGLGVNGSNLAVLLQGEFAAATLSATSITFDPQAPGTTSPAKKLTFTNTGTSVLTISNISLNGANAGDFAETNTCGASLAAGASCQISVTITPTVVGNRTGAVSVTDNAPGSPQGVALTGTVQDFTIASVPPTSETVTAGQAANYSVTFAPVLGFAGSVSLSCSGAPTNSTCTVTPSSLPGTGTPNVAVVTQAPAGAFTQEVTWPGQTGIGWWLTGAFGIVWLVSGTWRVRSPRLGPALLVFCMVSLSMWIGCGGGGGNGGGGGGGTPTGTYTLKVTGTYTAGGVTVSHSTNFTLIVK